MREKRRGVSDGVSGCVFLCMCVRGGEEKKRQRRKRGEKACGKAEEEGARRGTAGKSGEAAVSASVRKEVACGEACQDARKRRGVSDGVSGRVCVCVCEAGRKEEAEKEIRGEGVRKGSGRRRAERREKVERRQSAPVREKRWPAEKRDET